ncbi:HutD family protein [Streptomyces sp. NPDC087440]|uniref:HutD/Ves family protein n=1 Tax=Streptomyces sp. NPDC087440 TaxID=3365790 RepID=UPI00380B2058
MKLLRAADRVAVPWKNGGGITREIAARPQEATGEGFGWRVSLAEVAADGPFSAFPGVDRVLTMVEGDGMDLALEGIGPRRVDTRFVPQHFPGDVPTGCRLLGGSVVNLNVMHRRGSSYGAEVEVVTGDVVIGAPQDGGTRLALPLDPGADFLRQAATPLERYDALAFTGTDPGGLLRTTGRTAVITLRHP